MEFHLRPWNDLDVMSIRELCGVSNAHDARAHEPNASPTPPKFEFEVIPFGDGQSGDNFSVCLVSRVVDGHILSRHT